jgi:membrane protease YdiL (CAAX protease family)
MYIRQVLKENSNRWIDFLKLVFTCLLVFIVTLIFSIPHAVVLFQKMLEDAGADLDSLKSIMTVFPKIEERLQSMDVADQMSILEPNLNLFLMLLGFCGMLITVIICNKYVNGNSFLSLTTSRSKIDFSRIFFSFGLWSTISVVMIILGYFLSPESYVLNFNLIPFLILSLIVLLLIPIQTSAEEYVFRGYIIQNLGIITRNRWFPLIASSLIFGIIHGQNPEIQKFGGVVFIFYIGSGLFAGIMTLMDEGIELALGWHAANNMTIALLVTADWTALQTHSILKDISNPDSLPLSEVLIPVLVFFPLVLYIFSKKYGWKDWSEKLLGKI